MEKNYVNVDGTRIELAGEKNLLEVIRKAGIDLPTFCYHSELSVYGACRMCICEVEGRGLQPTCSTPPEPGMVVRTNTQKTMRIRKMALELLLANHHGNCQTCDKNTNCRLQSLAEKLGVKNVRFSNGNKTMPIDDANKSLVRDPNKCILCGDCVRMCKEVQGIGVLDFTGRGSTVRVSPAFGKGLNEVECVYCGQCATCCPTGALTVKSEVDKVWNAIYDPEKVVVVQVAPAVRVAVGEAFGVLDGELAMGKTTAAMRRIGFNRVYDTSFTADLTTMEEGTEFLKRLETGEKLPQFTSCCPGWVKFAEQFYPEFVNNLSSCKSPQQMFGSLAKKYLPKELEVKPENLMVVSVMPCTAKKFEAARPEFSKDGIRDVDVVLTTQELVKMIGQAGIIFAEVPPESMDMPFGFKTGAGIIFGASGGVAEAVLRLATSHEGQPNRSYEFHAVRGLDGVKEVEVVLNGETVRLAVVNGLANTRELLEKIKSGESKYDIVEVMSCRGGCIGGGGQPYPNNMEDRERRKNAIYDCDRVQALHNAKDNPFVQQVYRDWLKTPNSPAAHQLLHTHYKHRRRLTGEVIDVQEGTAGEKVQVSVCIGTCCYSNGSYDTMRKLMDIAEERGYADLIDFKASFCFENCDKGPNVEVNGMVHGHVTPDKVDEFIENIIEPAIDKAKALA
ncbi:MAG: NADH-dependent [FeFe] hydrogenase, group A6 [Armatimonadota bacterium]|nr:[FeFe] hydrogenase, group A [bacterium]